MGRAKKRPTKTIRVFDTTADELHRLAAVFGVDVATLVEETMRELIERKNPEAAELFLKHPQGKKKT